MNVIIYFSLSKKKHSQIIASSFKGDIFELVNLEKKHKFKIVNMFIYGYKTMNNKDVLFKVPNINFDKYEHVILVSPVWAGKVNIFMKKYLEKVKFTNKNVTLVSNSMGVNKNYFKSYDGLLDNSNKIIEEITYIKGERI